VTAAPAPEVPARHFRAAATDPEIIERNHVLLGVSDVAVARAYKILRTRVLHRLAANGWRSVGITGTTVGEGKSLTAINLALALAQEVNTWVFLVDLDLQRSQVGGYLGMNVDFGLTDYLTGQCELDQCVYDIGVRRLAVIPNVRRAENSSEFLTSPRMGEFVQTLSDESPRRVICSTCRRSSHRTMCSPSGRAPTATCSSSRRATRPGARWRTARTCWPR